MHLPPTSELMPPGLHIPDGFLSLPVALLGWLLALAALAYALRQVRGRLGERQVPVMGVMAAFLFAAQAINFPVAGGTSGHLLGGALAAIVLGPWAGLVTMAAVVALQALLFQDGGLLAMGWNVVNMGVLTALSGGAVYALLWRLGGRGRGAVIAAGALGGWLSVQAGAAATALELALSGTTALRVALPAMLGIHALIGVGEGLITVGALLVILRTRPDLLLEGQPERGVSLRAWAACGLLVALILAGLSALASAAPDGLERVALDLDFLRRSLDPLFRVFPDYTLPWVGHPILSGILAVTLGTLTIFLLVLSLGALTAGGGRAAPPGGQG